MIIGFLPTLGSKTIDDELNSYDSCEYIPDTYLIETTWGQRQLYKAMCPWNESDPDPDKWVRERLGCWSVAIGQIINYHSSYHPVLLQSVGVVDYDCTKEWINPQNIVNDLNDFDYDWSQMANELTDGSSASEKENVQRLLYDTATVIQKDFGTGSYLKHASDGTIILELIEHFPAINAFTVWDDDLTQAEIIEEIDHSRPIMFYMDAPAVSGHAVVLDGYKYETIMGLRFFYIHLNYGWYGDTDGWYYYYGPFPGGYDNIDYRKGLLIRLCPWINVFNGPIFEAVDNRCIFTVASTYDSDPPLYYMFDWDDETPYEWLGPYQLGSECNAYHSWSSPGIYNVKVKAKNNMGCQSDWFEPLTVHITRYSFLLPVLEFLLDLIDQFPNLESYLMILINLICS